MPETQSKEKIDFLRMIGADLRLVPAKPYRDPGNYVHVSRRMAEETGAVWANQFDNLANREGHRDQHRAGNLGADRRQDRRLHLRLRHRRHAGRRGAGAEGAQPEGAHRAGRLRGQRALWLGQKQRPDHDRQLDHRGHRPVARPRATWKARRSTTPSASRTPRRCGYIYDVLIHEGLSVGTSSGINIAAAVRVAKAMGPGHTVVTILADGGSRYQSKLFNPEFLRSKDLPVPPWMA